MKSKSHIFRRSILDGVSFALFVAVVLSLIFNPSDEDLMNLPLVASIFVGAIFVGGIISHFLNKAGYKTFGENLFEPAYIKARAEAKPWYKAFWGWHLFLTIVVLFVVSIFKTKFSMYELLDQDGFEGAKRLFKGIFSPNWNVLPTAILNIIETIFMAFLATFLAIPFAFVLSFMAAKNIMKGPFSYSVYIVLRTVMNVTRSIEALVWAIIFSVWVGIGPFAGMLALMIHSISSLTKQYSEMVETVYEGPIEGVQSCGANKLQTIWFAIVPQVILPYISFTVYRWDINVRMATIIGLVGGGGIGTMLIKYQGQAMWPEVGTIIVVIAAVVWLMDQASAYIREALK
ncbi:phosphonate ABC transporter, permease protein PhnE [Pseudobdellovibrio exovorus]|uniref:ABC-type phosphonates transport system permease protein n=1 Tax=Pseudobdellovibrio exovorus JSS TaxID=1184267 RepID=M4VDQ4_9BACT|nr:phosphonate ABC transporter, permease protein PhnE [Pseudobdellovibrio exovorus]AGH96171.1 ABC-type phosphonates transport system permease protein [Pseudobdellovibrio exovorus JSS]